MTTYELFDDLEWEEVGPPPQAPARPDHAESAAPRNNALRGSSAATLVVVVLVVAAQAAWLLGLTLAVVWLLG